MVECAKDGGHPGIQKYIICILIFVRPSETCLFLHGLIWKEYFDKLLLLSFGIS